MTKTQCFIKRSKEGANDILKGIFSIKDYGDAIIRMIGSVFFVLLVILPLIIYGLLIMQNNSLSYVIGLLFVFAFLEIVWIKCVVTPLVSCLG